MDGAVATVLDWARAAESRSVCFATSHTVMECQKDDAFRRAMNGSDLVLPDGMPLVWALRALGVDGAERVCGPQFLPAMCAAAAAAGVPVGFYGGHTAVLDELVATLTQENPGLQVAYRWSPPFRPLRDEEDRLVVKRIAESGARIVFVALGSVVQESWTFEHRGRVDAVLLGVGQAVDIAAGRKRQPPAWVQNAGLEWADRLLRDPVRLWKRYLVDSARIVPAFARQYLRERRRHT